MNRTIQNTVFVLLTLLMLSVSLPANAQRNPNRRPPPPDFVARPMPIPGTAVAVSQVTVNATIRDGVAETEMSQTFANRSDIVQEGDFLFPIPVGASVSSFAMYDGEKKLEARLLEKDEATRTYEEIVRRRRDPALLTFQGRSLLRARVFPINPHSERRVTLKLVTVLPREGSAKKYVWTLLGPHLGTGIGSQPEHIAVHIELNGTQAIGNVYSPTHDVTVRRDSERRIVINWNSEKGGVNSENPELALYISPSKTSGAVALSLLTYNASLSKVASVGGGVRQSGYFLVVASPALPVDEKAILPRHVVLVLDRSGSMQGEKIDQARRALRFALGTLRPTDSFNLITFSDKVEPFAPELLAATPDNLKRARAFVDDIVADGGTNINDALKIGLAQFKEKSTGNTLLFFTDGLPTVGITDRVQIEKNAVERNERKARVFTFGVGYDVDVPFLDRIAESLRGDADYVRPNEDIEVKTSRFVAKTRAPVLENLKLSIGGANVGEVYPKSDDLPDLFAGGQLVLVGRYTGASDAAKITLTGMANGKPQTYHLSGAFPNVDTDSGFLPRLWATRKIGYLLDEVRLRDNEAAKKEIVEQIVSLSREFGVLTPYTALFVPEPGTVDIGRPMPVAEAIISRDADNSLHVRSSNAKSTMGGGGQGAGGFGGAGGSSLGATAVFANPTVITRQGESAVNTSQGGRALRAQAQVGNSNYYAMQAGRERTANADLAKRIQNANNRSFYQIGTVWTDATYDAKKQTEIVTVKAFSPAYFALTRRNADLAKWASLGDSVLIAANSKQAIQFSNTTGRESLSAAEVNALAGK